MWNVRRDANLNLRILDEQSVGEWEREQKAQFLNYVVYAGNPI